MKIWANCVVHNEENFLWFAVMSIIDYVDKVLIYDTGSDDRTVDVINELINLKGEKIIFKEAGKVDKYQFTKIRQEMLDRSKCDWILVLDGDEVWWQDSIKKLVTMISSKGPHIESIVVPFYNLLGDIYHYQDEVAGEYRINNLKGHLTIRALSKKIPGLYVGNPYGSEGYFDLNNSPIQTRDQEKILFLDTPFLHMTHLKRSSKAQNQNKIKHELGISFTKNFKFPEVLSNSMKPSFIPDPFQKRSLLFTIRSAILTPPRKLKRKIFK